MKYLRPCLWALAVLWQITSVKPINRLRLWRKSINLYLCCLAFTDKERPREQLRGAMTCALLSALYDYETDWVTIENIDDSVYLRTLKILVPDPLIREPAKRLFEADLNDQLSEDGLERGSTAFTFYTTVINSRWLRMRAERLNALGRCLQMLDDALDLEADRANGHKNCFLTANRGTHLEAAARFLESDFFVALGRNSRVYRVLGLAWARIFDRMRAEKATSDKRAAADVKKHIKTQMLRSRWPKYAAWFMGIAIFKRIAQLGEFFSFVPGLEYFEDGMRRAEAIESIYTASHFVDDVVDRDAELPDGYASSVEYVDRIIHVIDGIDAPRDAIERLFVYGLGLARQTGVGVAPDLREVMLSLRFDAVRQTAGSMQVFKKAEMQHHFHFRDTIGVIGICLKLMREWYVKYSDLSELGEATRIYYNLRDLKEDVRARLFNIPAEDVDLFGISLPDHVSEDTVSAWCRSVPVRKWCAAEAERGLALLATYRKKRPRLQLHSFTRAVLHWMYERKTDAYLRRIIQPAR